jgi:general secretion pathway protein D
MTLRRAIACTCIVALNSAFGQAPPAAAPPQAATQTPPAPPQPAQTPPAQTQPAQPRLVGAVNFNNQPLLDVINVLAGELHINYILDAGVKGGAVTINTYGTGQGVELRPLFETILRMNNLAMVQVGDIYRIVPIGNISHLPISPVTQSDPSKIPDDERLVLNMVFLHYATSAEMAKVLTPFVGDGGQIQSYDQANLLILIDNSRNMKRTLELVQLFDSETFAGQRVRAFEVKNRRPSDLSKELEQVFKAYSLSSGKEHGAVQFVPIDAVNTILSVAPNPSAFTDVEKWIEKLDIAPKAAAGGTQNHVYKLK